MRYTHFFGAQSRLILTNYCMSRLCGGLYPVCAFSAARFHAAVRRRTYSPKVPSTFGCFASEVPFNCRAIELILVYIASSALQSPGSSQIPPFSAALFPVKRPQKYTPKMGNSVSISTKHWNVNIFVKIIHKIFCAIIQP